MVAWSRRVGAGSHDFDHRRTRPAPCPMCPNHGDDGDNPIRSRGCATVLSGTRPICHACHCPPPHCALPPPVAPRTGHSSAAGPTTSALEVPSAADSRFPTSLCRQTHRQSAAHHYRSAYIPRWANPGGHGHVCLCAVCICVNVCWHFVRGDGGGHRNSWQASLAASRLSSSSSAGGGGGLAAGVPRRSGSAGDDRTRSVSCRCTHAARVRLPLNRRSREQVWGAGGKEQMQASGNAHAEV